MDPDEALRLVRFYIRQMRREDRPVGNTNARLEFVQHARDLAEVVTALDEWLSNGGFAPAAWPISAADPDRTTDLTGEPT